MSLPRREQTNAFDALRNFSALTRKNFQETLSYIRERKGGDADELVICASCKGSGLEIWGETIVSLLYRSPGV